MRALIRLLMRQIVRCVPGLRELRRLQRLSWALEQCYHNQGLIAAQSAGQPQMNEQLTAVDNKLGTLSALCCERDFQCASYHRWCAAIGEAPKFHRKQWEFVAIAAAFEKAGILRTDARVLGFGVGTEPLPALFAKYGMQVLATDQDANSAQAQGWVDTNQHASSLSALSRPQVISDEQLAKQVRYQALDMNHLPQDLGTFDGIWSACSIEHLGSIEQTLSCMVKAMSYVKPGGIAVHTTEFNLSSNTDTLAKGPTVLLRERDVVELQQRLQQSGCELAALQLERGDGFLDNYVDIPPYHSDAHLRLLIEKYCSTSIVLIIRKPSAN